jgi:hypothetical protein
VRVRDREIDRRAHLPRVKRTGVMGYHAQRRVRVRVRAGARVRDRVSDKVRFRVKP